MKRVVLFNNNKRLSKNKQEKGVFLFECRKGNIKIISLFVIPMHIVFCCGLLFKNRNKYVAILQKNYDLKSFSDE